MGDIISLVEKIEATDAPNPGVIEALEIILKRAQAGEVQGIRIATCDPHGAANGMVVGVGSYALLGMLHALADGLSAQLDEAELDAETGV
jgi:hypothetical protein